MAKLSKLPAQHIIDGFKGIIDYYEYKGIPCARMWPRWKPRAPTAPESYNQQLFSYIMKWSPRLPPIVRQAYIDMASGTPQRWQDLLVQGYIHGFDF